MQEIQGRDRNRDTAEKHEQEVHQRACPHTHKYTHPHTRTPTPPSPPPSLPTPLPPSLSLSIYLSLSLSLSHLSLSFTPSPRSQNLTGRIGESWNYELTQQQKDIHRHIWTQQTRCNS